MYVYVYVCERIYVSVCIRVRVLLHMCVCSAVLHMHMRLLSFALYVSVYFFSVAQVPVLTVLCCICTCICCFFVTYSHLFCFVELVHACSRKYKFKFKCTCVYLCSWQTRSLTPELVSLQVRASSRRRVPVAGIVKKVMIVRATGTEVMQFFQESCSWSTLSYWWPGDRAERRGAKHLAFEARRASWVRAGGWCLLVPMREQIGWLKEICGVWWGRREGSEIQGCPVYMWESLVLSP